MIIGIMGKAGSGKDTAADLLVEHARFAKVSLADPLKRICKDVFAFSDEQLWGPSAKRNEPDKRYPRKPERTVENPYLQRTTIQEAVYLTPRYALQQLGTEWGRSCYGNVWVDLALRVAKQLLDSDRRGKIAYSARHGIVDLEATMEERRDSTPFIYDGVVIPDVRFQNEVDAIKAAGGKIWRITRPGAGLLGAAGEHASEKEQESVPDEVIDIWLNNEGSLDEFAALVEGCLLMSKSKTLQTLLKERAQDVAAGKIIPFELAKSHIPPYKRKG